MIDSNSSATKIQIMFYSKDKCLALFSIECKAYENNFLFESKAFFNQYLKKADI
ncbi:hypothetical protein M141_4048 [Bacteroides fragilis str. S38L5]|nr:hypothetical protein M141_4048 [Bacteroides fragilis str. S38L5]